MVQVSTLSSPAWYEARARSSVPLRFRRAEKKYVPERTVWLVGVGRQEDLILPVRLPEQAVLDQRRRANVRRILACSLTGDRKVQPVAGEPTTELRLIGGLDLRRIEPGRRRWWIERYLCAHDVVIHRPDRGGRLELLFRRHAVTARGQDFSTPVQR